MPRSTEAQQACKLRGVGAVVLAAGASRRLGRPKQLVERGGLPLVRRAVESASAAGCFPVRVVVPAGTPDADALASAIREALTRSVVQVELLPNPDWESGMASSIRTGVRRARADAPVWRALMLLVADQSGLTADPLHRLIEAFSEAWPAGTAGEATGIAACSYGGVAGVPALFGACHWDALESLQGDTGAREIVRSATNRCIHVVWPAGSRDLDRPEDLDPG